MLTLKEANKKRKAGFSFAVTVVVSATRAEGYCSDYRPGDVVMFSRTSQAASKHALVRDGKARVCTL